MTTNEPELTPGEYYSRRVALPEVALLAATIILVIVARHGCPGIGGIFAFVLGGGARRLDHRLFALFPVSMWPQERRQGAGRAALGACVLFTMMLLGIFLATRIPVGLVLVTLLVRALVPGIFTLYWYTRFADEIFPLIQSGEYANMLAAMERETAVAEKQARLADATKNAHTRSEDAQRQGRRMKAVQEARQSVLKFYRPVALVLRPFITADRLHAELPSVIPDTATEEEAFAGACALLNRLEGFIGQVNAERKAEQSQRQERRETIAGIDRQIASIRQEIQTLQGNGNIDPELRDAEIQALELKRRSLVEQRSMLQARG